MTTSTVARSGAIALLAFAAWVSSAHATEGLPAVHSQHGIELITGGVGQDESQAIRQAARNWPLLLEFSQRDHGHALYTAGVEIRLSDAKGRVQLQTLSDGPLMLVRVKPGTYRIDATLNGHTLHQPVVVPAHGTARLSFVWPYDRNG